MNNVVIIPKESTKSVMMVPVKPPKVNLVTEHTKEIYVPLASKHNYGIVKIGEGILIDSGVISFDRAEIKINTISKNGVLIAPDENKNINIELDKTDVGLSNVDNTSDIDKPVSTAQAEALSKKLDIRQSLANVNKILYVNRDGYLDFKSEATRLRFSNNNELVSSVADTVNFSSDFVLTGSEKVNISLSDTVKQVFKSITYNPLTSELIFVRYNDSSVSITLPFDTLDSQIRDNATDIVELNTRTETLEDDIKTTVTDVTINHKDGTFTFTKKDGSTLIVDTLLEKVVTNFRYDETTKELILTLEDDSVQKIPMSAFIDDYAGVDGAEITITVSGDNKISAVLKNGSVDANKLTPTLRNKIENIPTALSQLTDDVGLGDKADRSELFSGDYSDLENKPDIPLRIIKKATVEDAEYVYYPLAILPVHDSENNNATLLISGRLGGMDISSTSNVVVGVGNKSVEDGIVFISSKNATNASACGDVVVYRQADGTSLVYLKMAQRHIFDLDVYSVETNIIYDGSYVVDPIGSWQWAMSTAKTRLTVDNLKAYMGDSQLATLNDIDLAVSDFVDKTTIQEILGIKTFTEQIGLKNINGDVDYIKHINNNFLISGANGTSLLNIDEGLNKIYAFNKELAFVADLDTNYLSFTNTEQTLTEDQQGLIRRKIGAGSGSFSGDYNELTNKPTIPTTTSQLTNDSNFITINDLPDNIATTDMFDNYTSKTDEKSLSLRVTSDSWYTQNSDGTVTTGSGTQSITYSPTNGPDGLYTHTLTRATNVTKLANAFNALVGRVKTNEQSISEVPTLINDAITGLGTVFDLKGTKATIGELPTTGNDIGDVWYVASEQVGYIWLNDGTEDKWERFGAPIDLSGYITTTQFDTKMDKAGPVGTGSFSMNRKASTTVGVFSTTLGGGNTASGYGSYAEGVDTTAAGQYSHAQGLGTIANGNYQMVFGRYNLANSSFVEIVGYGTSGSDRKNIRTLDSLGSEILAGTLYVFNDKEVAVKEDVSSKMDKVNPTGTGSFSLNRKADTTIGEYSFAEGINTTASGWASHAEGDNTTASGDYAHAEGYHTTASGNYAHTEGSYTTASGVQSHAEGYRTNATSMCSHAEGKDTTASNVGAHAEGQETIASDAGAHAEGLHTTASGWASHAEGEYTIASSEHQHVFGKCNIEDAANTYIEIVGNGSLSSPANARTLDWSGNQWLAGTSTAQAFNTPSDRRLKENIKDYKCKKSILDLAVKEFDYKKTGTHSIGCIAQDLQEICPEIVNTDKDGYLSIQENKLVYLLLQEVKELKAEIDRLKEV